MILSAQIALYPLAASDFEARIGDALKEIKGLREDGLTIEIGSMSTILRGEEELVWKAVRLLFNKGGENGMPLVMTMTLSNECGC